ncbi:SDR family oxidoreductase [Allosediminivita pacifica]|uniref:NAD(P)H dehydrogenase (Quinone) n=1 Tax=Allosediminivita pacifica TaxID=1267769 RepID=A0A2T6B7X3_9RHOB|nr:SDR family oxidoreductase [Allosediminivita pacifica]PTX52146.1 NAD(P)H dehydrogenase (quinone) [Allosediminivita pacifica]GGA96769.1 NAD(P)-dependent oxidoreductase [Allosediminivita pacifica]
MTIAITGATGQLGRLTVQKLVDMQGADGLVALARSPEKAEDLGVETRAFDYDRPETLAPALDGVDVLVLISSSEVGKREAQHGAVIEAAKAAGVTRIVYTSILHADSSPMSLAPEHRATEALLAASGLKVTLLRNGWYHANYLGALPAALEHGAMIGAAGEGRISSAAREDFAEAAAVAATGEGHEGKTYELAGDEAYTLAELAEVVSAQTGKQIPYVNMTEAEYAEALKGAGLDAGTAQMVVGLDAGASQDALFDDSRTLSRLIGHPTTPISEAVRRALA